MLFLFDYLLFGLWLCLTIAAEGGPSSAIRILAMTLVGVVVLATAAASTVRQRGPLWLGELPRVGDPALRTAVRCRLPVDGAMLDRLRRVRRRMGRRTLLSIVPLAAGLKVAAALGQGNGSVAGTLAAWSFGTAIAVLYGQFGCHYALVAITTWRSEHPGLPAGDGRTQP